MAYNIERRTGERGTAGGHWLHIGIIEMSVIFVCKLAVEKFRYRGADKSLARPDKKTIKRSPFFVRRGGHCRGDLVGRINLLNYF